VRTGQTVAENTPRLGTLLARFVADLTMPSTLSLPSPPPITNADGSRSHVFSARYSLRHSGGSHVGDSLRLDLLKKQCSGFHIA
jgi:hypothetical protein